MYMAFNIITDKKFDEALNWLSQKEKKTKADIIRELVLQFYEAKQNGFRFGALKHLSTSTVGGVSALVKELKKFDQDDDLD
jgi:hypothetical protein